MNSNFPKYQRKYSETDREISCANQLFFLTVVFEQGYFKPHKNPPQFSGTAVLMAKLIQQNVLKAKALQSN